MPAITASGICATVSAIRTVIGPVGAEICARVPSNIAAKKPQKIALYNPARGPAPEETPNAGDRGGETAEHIVFG